MKKQIDVNYHGNPPRKLKLNKTMYKLSAGMMKWKRRIAIPMWHPSHVSKAANILREYADRIAKIEQSNSMRGSDRTTLAQNLLVEMNHQFSMISPQDPRERGAERYEFLNGNNHMSNTNGFDDLAKRDELNDDD
tara:strand:- start:293 stop:697 length:405 start_codon:yes stop_codon:yes gene_type:complete